MNIPLIAVIGPVEPGLLHAFRDHYSSIGVTSFHLAFHFTAEHSPAAARAVLSAARDLPGPPPVISRGPWHEPLHSQLRDQLRAEAGGGWQMIADSDEFHAYPGPIAAMIAEAERAGSGVIGGVLLDRVRAGGLLCSVPVTDTAAGLDQAYPLGGFLTWKLLGGDPRKVVLARSGMPLALGSHRSPGNRPRNDPLVVVHHFKWRPGVTDDLRRRIRCHSNGEWHEQTPAIRTEAGRLLAHLDQNGGRIDTTSPDLAWRPAALTAMPSWWPQEAARVAAQFRPPASAPDHP